MSFYHLSFQDNEEDPRNEDEKDRYFFECFNTTLEEMLRDDFDPEDLNHSNCSYEKINEMILWRVKEPKDIGKLSNLCFCC